MEDARAVEDADRGASGPALRDEARALLARARLAADLADLCARGAQPGALGLDAEASAQAVSLYREAARWALAAAHPGAPPRSLAEEFEGASAEWSTRLGADAVEGARRALVLRTADETFALDPSAQRDDARAAARFTRAVMASLDREDARRRAGWSRAVVAAAVAVALALGAPIAWSALRADLLRAARWRASSSVEGFPARGERARVPVGGTPVFFHTAEEDSPWVEFDLGAPRALREVEVQNREDCCAERAAPLALELSDDGRGWRQVARQDRTFRVWTAPLAGARARYLRLRSLRRTSLHLREVRVY